MHTWYSVPLIPTCALIVQWNLSITDTKGTSETVLYMEVSLIQRLSNAVIYYCGMTTATNVLNREASFIQRVLNREVPLY